MQEEATDGRRDGPLVMTCSALRRLSLPFPQEKKVEIYLRLHLPALPGRAALESPFSLAGREYGVVDVSMFKQQIGFCILGIGEGHLLLHVYLQRSFTLSSTYV